MKPIRDTFIVYSDKSLEYVLKLNNGLDLYIDPDFNKYHNAVQFGIVEQTPCVISKNFRNDVEIKIGDKVYFHHFVVQDNNEIEYNGKKCYKCNYKDIYCIVRDGQIIMLEDWIFSVPINKKSEEFVKSGIYLPEFNKKKIRQCKIVHVSKYAKRNGLKEGMIAIHIQGADYEMPVEGKKLLRMRTHFIIAAVEDGSNVNVKSVS